MGGALAVLQTVLPVFLVLAIGMLCRRRSFLSRSDIDALKKVVVNLTLPFVLVDAFAKAEYTARSLLIPLLVFVVCCAALALGFLFARVSGMGGKSTAFFATGFEAGMLGYALFVMLYPQVSTAQFAILDLGQTLFVFTVFKGLLSGKTGVKAVGRDILASPVMWAVIAGVFLGATGLYDRMHLWGVGNVLDAVTSFLSAPTGMIILLCVGYDLVFGEVSWTRTLTLVGMRVVILGVLLAGVILLNRTVLDGIIFEGAAAVLFILPAPYAIPIFTDQPEERTWVASTLSAMTVLMIVLFSVLSVVVGISQ